MFNLSRGSHTVFEHKFSSYEYVSYFIWPGSEVLLSAGTPGDKKKKNPNKTQQH